MTAAGVVLASCTKSPTKSQAATPPPIGDRDPGTLVVAVDASVENLDPATNIEWAYGLAPVYDTLVKLSGTDISQSVPSIATDLSAANADASTWQCTLRPDLLFQDGSACDAQALKAAITRTVTLKGGQGYLWAIDDPAKQIQVVDPQGIRIDFGFPRPYFNLEAAGQYGFWIASPAAAEQHSTGPADQGHEWLQSHPVGTGPYVVESNDPGNQITFAKSPKYWGGWSGTHFDKIITRTIPESGTRRQLLDRGDADIIWPGTPNDTVQLGEDPRFHVTDAQTFTMEFIALGAYGPLADPRARQAMNHAFDRDGYLKGIARGTLDTTHGVFPDLLATADPSIQDLPFDLTKAKQLFDAAGVAPGTEMTYEYFTGFGGDVGEVLQASLSQIGLNLKLVEKSFTAFVGDYFSDAPPEKRSSMYFFSWWPNYNHPYDWTWVLFSKDAAGSAGANVGFYDNAEASGIIDSMYNAVIDDKLTSDSRRLQQILAVEDPPWVPVAQEPTHMVYRNDIQGLVLNPLYVLTLDMYGLHRTSGS